MIVEQIYIQKRHIIHNADIELRVDSPHAALSHVYGKLAITLVAGRNGSGKSLLLSFICQIFHHLERSPEKIEGAFSFRYTVSGPEGRDIVCEIYRDSDRGPVQIAVDGESKKIFTRDKSGRGTIDDEEVAYSDISNFLPKNVIVSGFSMRGEYPSLRPHNFIGDRRLKIFDMSMLYGRNHFKYPPFSPGIARLMLLWIRKDSSVEMLQSMLGATITGRVLVRKRAAQFYNEPAEWLRFSPTLLKREARGEIWLNDLEFDTLDGRDITLEKMSSGQKFLLARILSTLGTIDDGSIVIMEEPEMHLDPSWCRQTISLLVSFFSAYRAHLFIATHSFSLLNSVPTAWILLADGGRFNRLHANSRTLLANESEIAYQLYGPKPHVVEHEIRKRLADASLQQLEEWFKILGESALRYDIFLKLREQNIRLVEEVGKVEEEELQIDEERAVEEAYSSDETYEDEDEDVGEDKDEDDDNDNDNDREDAGGKEEGDENA